MDNKEYLNVRERNQDAKREQDEKREQHNTLGEERAAQHSRRKHSPHINKNGKGKGKGKAVP